MNILDRAIRVLSPERALRRESALAKIEALDYRRDLLAERLAQFRGYEAAKHGRRTKNWNPGGTSPNLETYGQLGILRSRMRDLCRNNSWASKALEVIDGDVVGSGVGPKFKVGSASGLDHARGVWTDWAETTECDPAGQADIYGIQGIAFRAVVESGEVLLRRRWRRSSDGLSAPMQIEVLEPDHLDSTRDGLLPNGGRVVQGVEFNAIGARVAYWLHREHPGDRMGSSFESLRVPAADVRHMFFPLRANQVRGIPWGAPTIIRLRNYDEFTDAQLLRVVIGNLFGAFITRADPNETHGKPLGQEGEEEDAELEELSPATLQYLKPGETVEFSTPPISQGLEGFSRMSLLEIAAGFNVPYELLTGDLSHVNYSSGRMGFLAYQRQVAKWQNRVLLPLFCRTIWGWLAEAYLLGRGKDLAQDVRPKWILPRREMIDPSKEVVADRERVRAGLASREDVVESYGYDADEVLDELGRDQAAAQSKGLALTVFSADDANRQAAKALPAGAPPKPKT